MLAWVALAAVVIGVLATWTTDGSVRLDGLDGSNEGWLALIVAASQLAGSARWAVGHGSEWSEW
jgi:hypothetical protein